MNRGRGFTQFIKIASGSLFNSCLSSWSSHQLYPINTRHEIVTRELNCSRQRKPSFRTGTCVYGEPVPVHGEEGLGREQTCSCY